MTAGLLGNKSAPPLFCAAVFETLTVGQSKSAGWGKFTAALVVGTALAA